MMPKYWSTKMIKPETSVLVLDLDDTIYAEADYKYSGIHSVCDLIVRLYPQYTKAQLLSAVRPESNSWLEELCLYCGFNDSEKNSLLWAYRLHTPKLQPFVVPAELRALCRQFTAAALITDGRSISQRLKLDAMGITDCFDHILVSEACQSEKPDAKRFLQLTEAYPKHQLIYIGDNIKKDFITPKQLGWLTIGIKNNERHIHRHQPEDFTEEYQPHRWITRLNELKDLLC